MSPPLDQHIGRAASRSAQQPAPHTDADLAEIQRHEVHLGRKLNRSLTQLDALQRAQKAAAREAVEVIDIHDAG